MQFAVRAFIFAHSISIIVDIFDPSSSLLLPKSTKSRIYAVDTYICSWCIHITREFLLLLFLCCIAPHAKNQLFESCVHIYDALNLSHTQFAIYYSQNPTGKLELHSQRFIDRGWWNSPLIIRGKSYSYIYNVCRSTFYFLSLSQIKITKKKKSMKDKIALVSYIFSQFTTKNSLEYFSKWIFQRIELRDRKSMVVVGETAALSLSLSLMGETYNLPLFRYLVWR